MVLATCPLVYFTGGDKLPTIHVIHVLSAQLVHLLGEADVCVQVDGVNGLHLQGLQYFGPAVVDFLRVLRDQTTLGLHGSHWLEAQAEYVADASPVPVEFALDVVHIDVVLYLAFPNELLDVVVRRGNHFLFVQFYPPLDVWVPGLIIQFFHDIPKLSELAPVPVERFVIVFVHQAKQIGAPFPEVVQLLDLVKADEALLLNLLEELQNINVRGGVAQTWFVFLNPAGEIVVHFILAEERQLFQDVKELVVRVPHEVVIRLGLFALRQLQVE